MRLQVSFYLLNKLCFPVIRMVFPAFEAFQGSLTKNLQELNNPEVQTPRPKHRAGTESRAGGAGGVGGGGGTHAWAVCVQGRPCPHPPSAGVSVVPGQPFALCLGLCSSRLHPSVTVTPPPTPALVAA